MYPTAELFGGSPLLTALRAHTRQCLVPPWAVLGVALQRVAAAYPAATVDGEPPNSVFALVGGAGVASPLLAKSRFRS